MEVAAVAGSNLARGMDVCLLCLYVMLSCVGRGLCNWLITRPEESYRVYVCVWSRNTVKGPYVPSWKRKGNEWMNEWSSCNHPSPGLIQSHHPQTAAPINENWVANGTEVWGPQIVNVFAMLQHMTPTSLKPILGLTVHVWRLIVMQHDHTISQ
jgi:hypothetical protein